MPELTLGNFHDTSADDDEDEDAAEEKGLMTILLKLKNAKSSLEANRKRSAPTNTREILNADDVIPKYNSIPNHSVRKRDQQLMDDTTKNLKKTSSDQLAKFRKKWSTKNEQVHLKRRKL
jgi:hypothetical protein